MAPCRLAQNTRLNMSSAEKYIIHQRKQDQPIKNMDFYKLHMRHICSVRQIRPERRNEETHQRQNKEAQRLPAPQQQ